MAQVETLDSCSSIQEPIVPESQQETCLISADNDSKLEESQVHLSEISTSSSPSVHQQPENPNSSLFELSNYFGIGHLLDETQEYSYETCQFTSCSQQCHEFLFKFHHGLLSSKPNSLMIDFDWEDHIDVVSVILQLVNQSEEKSIDMASTQLKAKIYVKCAESTVDLQINAISGIPLTSWIGKLVLPIVKFSHLPSTLSNLKEFVPLSEELSEEMKMVFFSSYPSLFRQYFNHFPSVNDQKNANMVLSDFLIGLLWIGCLNIEKSNEISSRVRTVMQRSIGCLQYWISNYGFCFDVLSSNFVKSSLQQIEELLNKIEKNEWKDELSGVLKLISEDSLNQHAFPLSFNDWSEYLSNKRKELGLDEEEEENAEEETQEADEEEEYTQVEEEGEDEDEEEEEEEVDVSEMFNKLSSFILSQHDLQATEIPEVFANQEEILLANLPNDIDSVYSIVLDIMRKSNPEKASFFEELAQPDLYLHFIMQWSPLEIAKQLTNYEFTNHFEQCKTHDFFSTGALSNNQSNLDQMIDRFNWMSLWIVYTILRQESLENRVKIIGYFVQVMFFTLSLQNYQNTMCIISAFHNSCISKLATAWKEVSELRDQTNAFTYHQFLEGVNDLLSLQKKFFKLKYHIIQNIETSLENNEEGTQFSCIPYVGVWLGEISSIETYYNDFVSPPTHLKQHHSHISNSNTTLHTHQYPHHYLFNYEKKRLITKPLKEIQTFQKLSLHTENENISLFKSVPLLLHVLSTNEMIKALPLDPSNSSNSPSSNGPTNESALSVNSQHSDLSPALSNISLSSNGSGFFQGQSTVMLKSVTNSEYMKKIFREMTKEILQKE
ncbi:rasGEF domain-containing protein [Naegleria gruberi]|uniref:RasGEF domain-containing protein n=1 Tax=Naegleria gruberi TaxID=5762 RepID=D2VXM7_NAEGR|nr:rasGEF domain-containing protein [Naegleria gruberi]EFC38469.1 rasGEF domain-containing protein [Naegleria gruberi]|eukprot:XP_002671213.1 rasGEF domain-containing protein [Naegleria gruberi strain NEG-M]